MRKLLILAIAIGLSSCLSEEEQKNKAEAGAKFLAEKKARVAKGIGEALKGEGKDAAESVTEGVGEVFKGANSGFDKSMTKVNVRVDESLNEYLEVGRSGKHYNDSTRLTDISVYIIFNKEFKNKLVLKAFDKENVELGRKIVEANKKEDAAEYIDFQFDERTPISLAEYFTLELKK